MCGGGGGGVSRPVSRPVVSPPRPVAVPDQDNVNISNPRGRETRPQLPLNQRDVFEGGCRHVRPKKKKKTPLQRIQRKIEKTVPRIQDWLRNLIGEVKPPAAEQPPVTARPV
jgi:hypothetical protein